VRAQIVVVGSCNLDLVVGVDHVPQVGETVMGSDVQRYPGGKGANQAVAAARLGCRVAMVGRVGDDEAGALLREALEADGVDTSALLTTPGVPSGTALIAVQDDGDNAIVVSPGANARVSPQDVAIPVVAEAELVLMQGEVPIEAVLEAARVAAGRVIWNPAPAPTEVPLELLDQVDIVVPNQTELAQLTGHRGPIDPETAIGLARRLPSSAVVVTLGADGALVVVDEDAVHVTAPRVTPVDTTAAGDAFCGALATGLATDDDLVAAVKWACRVGAAATLRRGAQPSLPTAAEVEALVG
jgi:ribokinase